FVLGSLRPPCVVAHATVPHRDRTISPRSVSSHASPHPSRVARCLCRHEPNRYDLMDESALNEQPSNKSTCVHDPLKGSCVLMGHQSVPGTGETVGFLLS